MTPSDLTEPQSRALRVLAASRADGKPRPVISSNYTTDDLGSTELLKVQRRAADALARYVGITLELTPEGRALAREAGWG